jgi:hypothetical protein
MNLLFKLGRVHEFENEIGRDPWSPIRDPKWIRVSVGTHEFENEIGS